MFTGIVQATSLLVRVSADSVEIALPEPFRGRLRVGGSVAVNGACLTARSVDERAFAADISRETRNRTTFSALRQGARVNLELPVAPDRGLDGHWVLGHVDAVGRVRALYRDGAGWSLVVAHPAAGRRYVVDKGSIAVDGISLTPFDVDEDSFRCAVIPETHEATTLRDRRPGDPVNLEYDVLAKYVERMIGRVRND